MKEVLTGAEVRHADQRTILEMEVPSAVLMERAALAVAEEVKSGRYRTDRILAVCGNGNNGGDGVAAARILHGLGYHADVYYVEENGKFSEELLRQKKIAENYGVPVVKNPVYTEYTVIVDAIFGIGLTRPLAGKWADTVNAINESRVPVVAVDIPSGVHTDTGAVLGCAVNAVTTVTFTCQKPGLLFYPGREYAGRVLLRDVGVWVSPVRDDAPFYGKAVEKADLRKILKRDPKGNKGTFGKVLVIAGSREMCGAAILCARAVLASGAGMVKVFTESSNRTPVLAAVPEAMVSLWSAGGILPAAQLEKDLAWADAVVIGPGLSGSADALAILKAVLTYGKLMLVIDADGINLIAEHPELLELCGERCIFTPHIGEMARLTGKPAEELKKNPALEALSFARAHGICCVMKDAVTVTASGKEGKVYYNESGCSALATAGSGDVLAGMIGGFAAKALREGKADPALCASLAVYAHGLAGEAAAEKGSETSVTASDVIRALPEVFSH